MYLSWSLLYFQPFYFVREDVSTKVKKNQSKIVVQHLYVPPQQKRSDTLFTQLLSNGYFRVISRKKKVFNANFVNTNKKIRTSFLHLIATHKHAGR